MSFINYLKYAVVLVMLPLIVTYGEPNKDDKADNKMPVMKVEGEPSYYRLNINNISTWFKNDGESDINPFTQDRGFEFPKGSGKGCVYQSGFLWGGIVNGQKRVGGSVYRQGTVPGRILNSGVAPNDLVAADPSAPEVRNYRVRPDYKTASLASEIADGEGTADEIRAAYEEDWNEWPAQYGAPYTDVDGNGSYDPAVDIPGFPGADQTIWFVCNDTDEDQTAFMYGSPTMGIEEQVTAWAYNTTGALGNMIFRRYKIINKSNATFDSMYVAMFSDADVGDSADDLIGCDTTLSMSFFYNGTPNDQLYGVTPPAVGFDFFQGPVVDGLPTDSAIVGGKVVYGKKNLPMTAHYFFIRGSSIFVDPPQGTYEGTIQWFNLFNGRVSLTGDPFIDPTTGQPTKFTVAGNVAAQEGWVGGILFPPADRRGGMVSGPFTMAPGDTQEIVIAEIAAGAFPPVGNIGAIGLLKFYDLQAQLTYDNFFNITKPAPAPQVEVTELDQEIVLNWLAGSEATESFNTEGYIFQGYNVYQLPSVAAGFAEAERIATFDKVDRVGTILGLKFDIEEGVVGERVLQTGTDAGVQRYISIKSDAFSGGLPLNNGSKYYFAVTSYSYNPNPGVVPNVLENPLQIITVVPNTTDPGVDLYAETDESATAVHATGSANATVTFDVVDPTKLIGHKYEVFFNQQHYYLDQNGEWQPTNFPDSIGKDVSPSTMSGTAVYADTAGRVDLLMTINYSSPDFAFIDAVKITLPPGIVINSAADETHCANGEVLVPVITGQTIQWGINDTSTFGCFDGSQLLKVNVNTPTLPLTIDYVLYDDGYGFVDGDTVNNNYANATGSFQITEIGNKFVTQNHWNVRDLATGEVVVEDQTVYNGVDIYADVPGPGGSLGVLGSEAPTTSNPVFDGLQVSVVGNFANPTDILRQTLNGDPLAVAYGVFPYGLTNFIVFGNATGWAIESAGYGTSSVDELQQDYEYRWTGVLDSTTINGKKVYITKEGTGSMATFYGARLYDWAQHPLNPTGTQDRFLVRIPFEVWNVDKNMQVNYQIYDRGQADPTVDGFKVWNTDARMYAEILNTPYEEVVHTPSDEPWTWNNVWNGSRWTTGDVIFQEYANPIQIGKDTYVYDAPAAASFSKEDAVEDVKNINVFPNPYYGVNPQELNKYQRFVTFSHLPEKATIRIFNLAGQLVRTIEKNSPGQFERWDLRNEANLPVASGLFIVYIDMPELGTTKVLKAAIIQEEQILDRF